MSDSPLSDRVATAFRQAAEDPFFVLRVDGCFVLRPVRLADADPASDVVRLLTGGRTERVDSFLTEFRPTAEGTAHWLKHAVVRNPYRILFAVQEPDQPPVGFAGLVHAAGSGPVVELDSILRSGRRRPGIMRASVLALVRWARDDLGLHSVVLRVRSDNSTAIEFYEQIGFVETGRLPLRRQVSEDRGIVSWIEDEKSDSELSVIYQEYQSSSDAP